MIDAVILDVDGTLWDSTGVVAKAWTKAVDQCGFSDMVITPQQLQKLFGKTMDVIAKALLPEEDETTRKNVIDRCCELEHEAVSENQTDITYEGVVDTMRKAPLPVAIVSNCQSGYIELFMDKTNTADCVVDLECFGNTGEGKAENIRRVVARNGWKNPIYVGDTAGDLEACRAAGVPFVWARYGFGEIDPRDAIAVIDSFSEVLDVIGYADI